MDYPYILLWDTFHRVSPARMGAHARNIKITMIPIFTELIRRFYRDRSAVEDVGHRGTAWPTPRCVATQPFRPFTRVNALADDITRSVARGITRYLVYSVTYSRVVDLRIFLWRFIVWRFIVSARWNRPRCSPCESFIFHFDWELKGIFFSLDASTENHLSRYDQWLRTDKDNFVRSMNPRSALHCNSGRALSRQPLLIACVPSHYSKWESFANRCARRDTTIRWIYDLYDPRITCATTPLQDYTL